MITTKDSYYNLVVLTSVTRTYTIEGANARLIGHTIQRDGLGNVYAVDNREIAYVPAIYLFADGKDLEGQPSDWDVDEAKTTKGYKVLKPVDVETQNP